MIPKTRNQVPRIFDIVNIIFVNIPMASFEKEVPHVDVMREGSLTHGGPCTYDVCNIFWLLDPPSPPCLHFHAVSLTKLPYCICLWGTPSLCRHHMYMSPCITGKNRGHGQGENKNVPYRYTCSVGGIIAPTTHQNLTPNTHSYSYNSFINLASLCCLEAGPMLVSASS